jgi:hypothetical protein
MLMRYSADVQEVINIIAIRNSQSPFVWLEPWSVGGLLAQFREHLGASNNASLVNVFDGMVNNLMGELVLQTVVGQQGV